MLGRAPDAIGLGHWTEVLESGAASLSEVAASLVASPEFAARYGAPSNAGFVSMLYGNVLGRAPDPEAVDVVRAYVAVLDRLPDAGGLASWTAAREAGLGRFETVNAFVASAEFQGRFGGLSNRDFVEQLYRTALDREADPDGLAAWARVLDAGADSRAGVAFGFADSVEMTVKVAPLVQDGFLLA